MRIEPSILHRHLEAAAAEQVAEGLRRRGFEVRSNERFGSATADLVAADEKGQTVYKFKIAGVRDRDWARQASELQSAARAAAARFHLVLVQLPREGGIEVDGLEDILKPILRQHLPQTVYELASHVQVDAVSDVAVSAIRIEQEGMELQGEGTVTLDLRDDDGPFLEAFPFEFELALDARQKLRSVKKLSLDLSSWLGTAYRANAAVEPEMPPALS